MSLDKALQCLSDNPYFLDLHQTTVEPLQRIDAKQECCSLETTVIACSVSSVRVSAGRLCGPSTSRWGPSESSRSPRIAWREAPLALGGPRDIPPCRERQQCDSLGGEARLDLRENAVVEDHEGLVNMAAGLADSPYEIQLRSAFAGEVLNQQNACLLLQFAFDLGVSAEPFRLLAHIEHRQ